MTIPDQVRTRKRHPLRRSVASVLMLASLRAMEAQPAQARAARGNEERAANRLTTALQEYQAAILADSTSYDALWKAAEVTVSLAEFDSTAHRRDSLFALGVAYGRRAVAVNPKDAEGHFQLARALGRLALTRDVRERAKFAVDVREHALAALSSNPNHAGALHVLGLWNQNVMQLGVLQRLAAKTLLGARVFGEASWDEAQRCLERSVALEPERIAHHLDLGRIYADRKRYQEARDQFKWVLAAPVVDYNDVHYKHEAESALAHLRQ